MSASSTGTPNVGRSAAVLFTASVIASLAIFLLNSSLYTAKSHYAETLRTFGEHGAMLRRLQLFKAHKLRFFEEFIASLAQRYGDYRQLISNLDIDADAGAFVPVYKKILSIRKLAGEAVELTKSEPNEEKRMEALEASFKHLFPESRLSRQELAALAGARTPNPWSAIAEWIVYTHGITFFDSMREDRISYLSRIGRAWGEVERKQLLLSRLFFESEEKAEEILYTEYLDAAKRAAETPKAVSQVGLSGLGVALSAGDALCLIPLALLLLAAHFAVLRSYAAPTESITFPQYRSPGDPMLPLGRLNPSDLMQRLIWAGFLALPLLIVTLGLVFRYDLVTPLEASRNPLAWGFWSIRNRADTYADAIVDTVAVTVGIAMLLFVHACTTVADTHASLIPRRRWSVVVETILVVIGAAAFVLAGWRLYWAGQLDYRNTWLNWYCVGTVWAFAAALFLTMVIGLNRGRRFAPLLSFVLLLAITLSLLCDSYS